MPGANAFVPADLNVNREDVEKVSCLNSGVITR